MIRTHCAACRTSLTFRRDGGDIDVTLASLDDPEALPPDYEGWLAKRLAWEAVDAKGGGCVKKFRHRLGGKRTWTIAAKRAISG